MHVASTSVVINGGVNDEGAGILVVLSLLNPLGHPGQVRGTAIEGRKTDRVQAKVKRQLVGIDLGFGVDVKESLSSGFLVVTAGNFDLS